MIANEDALFSYLESKDPWYLGIQQNERYEWVRSSMQDMWKVFSPFADPDFLSHFPHEFLRRSWELYLGYFLHTHGFLLQPRKGAKGADMKFLHNSLSIMLEATAPDEGDGVDKVPEIKYHSLDEKEETLAVKVPEEAVLLRLAGAFHAKSQKFQEWIGSGLIEKTTPCIIAINGCPIGHARFESDDGLPWIARALFGMSPLVIVFDRKNPTNKAVDQFHQAIPELKKKSESRVIIEPLLRKEFQHVSGVLYSSCDIVNLPTRHGDEFVFLHNPLASNPLPVGFFPYGREYVFEQLPDRGRLHRKSDWRKNE